MKIFLSLKHWQLFALIFLPPMLLYATAIIQLLESQNVQAFSTFMPAAMVLIFSLLFSWLYAVGGAIHANLQNEGHFPFSKFKWAMALAYLGSLAMAIGIIRIFSLAQEASDEGQSIANETLVYAFMMVGAYGVVIIGTLYAYWQLAKGLNAVEVQRGIRQHPDNIIDFIWFLFSMVGIWMLQPRINRLFGK